MTTFLQLIIGGLMIGAVYGLIALAIVIIYKSSSVFNFAQGALMLIGAYLCWSLCEQFGLPLIVSVVAALALSALLGFVINKLFMEPLIGQPLISVIIMTLALSIFIESTVTLFWGGPAQAYPPLFPIEPIHLGGVVLSVQHLYCFIIALILFGIMVAIFQLTKVGLGMRAVAEDHQAARAAGLSVKTTFAVVWILAATLATAAGFLQASMSGVDASLAGFGLKGFAAVLVGGLDSIPGAIVGGFIIGILENLAGGYMGSFAGGGLKEVAPYLVLILILIVKPYGLFGLERIERI